jgi:hypothetical protein
VADDKGVGLAEGVEAGVEVADDVQGSVVVEGRRGVGAAAATEDVASPVKEVPIALEAEATPSVEVREHPARSEEEAPSVAEQELPAAVESEAAPTVNEKEVPATAQEEYLLRLNVGARGRDLLVAGEGVVPSVREQGRLWWCARRKV